MAFSKCETTETGYSDEICMQIVNCQGRKRQEKAEISSLDNINKKFASFSQPGSVARPVISASERLASVDGLRTGQLSRCGSCRTGVRAKPCVHMGTSEESGVSRWSKEVRTGPGG